MAEPVEGDVVEGTHVAGPSSPDELDSFYEGDDNVLKSYAFDYGAIIKYEQAIAWQEIQKSCAHPCVPFVAPCIAYNVAYYFLIQKENIEDAVQVQHLAISRDGIRYVVDKHQQKQCCCFPDLVQGKVSKTVPYDKSAWNMIGTHVAVALPYERSHRPR